MTPDANSENDQSSSRDARRVRIQHIIPYPPDLPAMPESFALAFFSREISRHLRLGTTPGLRRVLCTIHLDSTNAAGHVIVKRSVIHL